MRILGLILLVFGGLLILAAVDLYGITSLGTTPREESRWVWPLLIGLVGLSILLSGDYLRSKHK